PGKAGQETPGFCRGSGYPFQQQQKTGLSDCHAAAYDSLQINQERKIIMRIPYETMVNEFKRVLMKYGFEESPAQDAAVIFAENSLAGVYSHGLNRFPRVIEYLKKGEIDPKVQAECMLSIGAFERWDGHRGFGP